MKQVFVIIGTHNNGQRYYYYDKPGKTPEEGFVQAWTVKLPVARKFDTYPEAEDQIEEINQSHVRFFSIEKHYVSVDQEITDLVSK